MRIRKGYSGFLHYSFLITFALSIGVISILQIKEIQATTFFVVPWIILYANFVEYFTHRWPLHHRIKGLGMLYERHGVQHHSYFSNRDMTIKIHHEMYYVLFPAIAIVIFIPLMAGPLSLIMGMLFSKNAGWLTLATSVFYFVWYETVHLANHLPRNHWVHRIPGITSLCRFHRVHHAPQNSKNWNFNVTFPLADWLMGTLKSN